jgi:tRNA threonylcarbamoyladenosine biosynthesis protein TsaE
MSESMSGELIRQLADEAATLALGAALGRAASAGAVIFLSGDLGAGKTTFSRGLLHGLGFVGAVKSPTYTLVEPYELPAITVYHFDLYRLHDPQELEYMGVRDYFEPGNLCLVEWPEKGGALLPEPDIFIAIQVVESGRVAHLDARSAVGGLILGKLDSKKISGIS